MPADIGGVGAGAISGLNNSMAKENQGNPEQTTRLSHPGGLPRGLAQSLS